MICGLPPALSVSYSVPVRSPDAVRVQHSFPTRRSSDLKVAGLVGQALAPVLVAAKSPEGANELIVKAAAPVFVSVTVIGALVVASGWLPKSRLRSEERRVGEERCSLRVMNCEIPLEVSESVRVPVRALEAVSMKFTLTMQIAPAT